MHYHVTTNKAALLAGRTDIPHTSEYGRKGFHVYDNDEDAEFYKRMLIRNGYKNPEIIPVNIPPEHLKDDREALGCAYYTDKFLPEYLVKENNMIKFKDFCLLQEKAGSDTTEYGCLMAVFSKKDAQPFLKFAKENITKDDLSDEGGYEDEIHTTVLFGFHGDLSDELKSLLSKWNSLKIKLGEISRFSNDKRDVIKVEVHSENIKELHAFLMKHYKDKITTDFPKWNGHITLAYVQPKACKELNGNKKFKNQEYEFSELVYSTPGMHKKIKIPLNTTLHESFDEDNKGEEWKDNRELPFNKTQRNLHNVNPENFQKMLNTNNEDVIFEYLKIKMHAKFTSDQLLMIFDKAKELRSNKILNILKMLKNKHLLNFFSKCYSSLADLV